MRFKKNIVRFLIGFFGLFFVLAFLFSISFKPLLGNSLVDISGFSDEQEVSFKTAGKERFFYEKSYHITDKDFSILNENRDMGVLVHRIPGYFYEVEFNGHTVGKVSDVYHKGSNIWNSAYIFIIDNKMITEDNCLTIRGESATVFNASMYEVFLGRYDKVSRILTIQKTLFQYFLIASMGFLIALGLAITLVKASDNYGENGYVWMAIGAVMFALYLLDYVEFWNLPVTRLFFRKFTILMLFYGIGSLGVGLGKRFDAPLLRRYSYCLFIAGTIPVLIASSFPNFKMFYSYASLALVGAQVLMMLTFVRVRDKIEFGWTLAAMSLIVIATTAYDVYGMINNLGTAKMSIYSVVMMIASVLIISIYHLSDDYFFAQNNAFQKEEEVSALMAHLYEDQLSGYKTFKYMNEQVKSEFNGMVSVAFSRLDALDAVSNNRGIEISERLLKVTYDIFATEFEGFENFFVDGKGQLVIILPDVHTEDAFKMLEVVRLKVMQTPAVKELCGYLPYTVTSGVATRVNDESIIDLIHKANLAMLNGEGHGRNQTVIYQSTFSEENRVGKENYNLMLNFVYTIINTIDSRDRYTSRHSEEVSKYSVLIGERLSFDLERLNALKIGSMLHDCGKLGVSDFILNKTEPLTEEENRIIRNHPIVGYQLARQIFVDPRILGAIKYHHEWVDGSGYPEGLAGEEIPLEAKIVSVADAYHAMTSSRKYGSILSHERAFQELEEGMGTQFDRQVVEAFKMCFDD
ncbi:MAG: HD domain-containing protein [Clostridia bacterium]|nr:HD domain-containing protein [Clostridia bacterium]